MRVCSPEYWRIFILNKYFNLSCVNISGWGPKLYSSFSNTVNRFLMQFPMQISVAHKMGQEGYDRLPTHTIFSPSNQTPPSSITSLCRQSHHRKSKPNTVYLGQEGQDPKLNELVTPLLFCSQSNLAIQSLWIAGTEITNTLRVKEPKHRYLQRLSFPQGITDVLTALSSQTL